MECGQQARSGAFSFDAKSQAPAMIGTPAPRFGVDGDVGARKPSSHHGSVPMDAQARCWPADLRRTAVVRLLPSGASQACDPEALDRPTCQKRFAMGRIAIS